MGNALRDAFSNDEKFWKGKLFKINLTIVVNSAPVLVMIEMITTK